MTGKVGEFCHRRPFGTLLPMGGPLWPLWRCYRNMAPRR